MKPSSIRLWSRKGKRISLEILPSQGALRALAPKRWNFRFFSWTNLEFDSYRLNGKPTDGVSLMLSIHRKAPLMPFDQTMYQVIDVSRPDSQKAVKIEFAPKAVEIVKWGSKGQSAPHKTTRGKSK